MSQGGEMCEGKSFHGFKTAVVGRDSKLQSPWHWLLFLFPFHTLVLPQGIVYTETQEIWPLLCTG